MHGKTIRSLPKDLRAKPGFYNRELDAERKMEAFVLWAAGHILEKYGFYGYSTNVNKIATHVSYHTIQPVKE